MEEGFEEEPRTLNIVNGSIREVGSCQPNMGNHKPHQRGKAKELPSQAIRLNDVEYVVYEIADATKISQGNFSFALLPTPTSKMLLFLEARFQP